MLQQRGFSLEIKSLNDKGEFSGMASVYGEVDLGGDIVESGAFQKSLRDRGNTRPLLWRHDAPIGLATLTDSAKALLIDGKLSMGVQAAREAYELLKDGAVKGLSIGYGSIPERTVFKDGIRYLQEVKLYEVSLTPVPMLESAAVTSVKQLLQKQAEEGDIRRALDGFRRDFERALGAR